MRPLLHSARTLRTLHSTSSSLQGHAARRNVLPEAPVEIGALQMNRMAEHYRRTLAPDMLYMMYEPEDELPSAKDGESAAESDTRVRKWDTGSPYEHNRSARRQRGNRPLLPLHRPLSQSRHVEHDLPRLERVVLTAFCQDAISNKQALLPMIGQLRAITGLPVLGSLADPAAGGSPHTLGPSARDGYVQVLRARTGAASFRLRPGMPIGGQAVMLGDAAYDFIESLTTFVLPRLRGFTGIPLPPASQPQLSPAAVSGVVTFGLGPEAMPLFPQVEVNLDQYPGRRFGFQIDCITNRRGRRATEQARTLLSGLGMPFVRRGVAAV